MRWDNRQKSRDLLSAAEREASRPRGPEQGRTPAASPSLSCARSQSRPRGDSQEPCPYSQGAGKFSCQLEVPEGDNSVYVVSLCVSSSAGTKSSSFHTFEGYGIRE